MPRLGLEPCLARPRKDRFGDFNIADLGLSVRVNRYKNAAGVRIEECMQMLV